MKARIELFEGVRDAERKAHKLHTAAHPGEHGPVKEAHLPVVELKGDKAKIVVPHEMTDRHFIQYVWAKDETNRMLGAAALGHGEAPELRVVVPEGTKAVTAYQCCNVHGVWAADSVAV